MPKCRRCDREFPNWVVVQGKRCNLQHRKFCLECSPHGKHNTRAILDGDDERRCSLCGETDPAKFYGKRRYRCGSCHNKYVIQKAKVKRQLIRRMLGNKCAACGFDKYLIALEIHHVDSTQKDPNFKHIHFWSIARIQKELKGCMLLCSNCHRAIHGGHNIFQDGVIGNTSDFESEDSAFDPQS